jgi:hypothetical protein
MRSVWENVICSLLIFLCLVSNVFLLDRDVLELSRFYLVCDLHVLLSAHTWIVFGSSIVSYT